MGKNADETYYKEPSAFYMDHDNPTIHFPGPVVYDTARFERLYVGRICVAFKNLSKIENSLTYSNIKKIEITASGVGVTQYLSAVSDSVNTRSARFSTDDEMKMIAEPFSVQYKDFEFGIQNYYFPSPDLRGEGRESEPIRLRLRFINQNNQSISSLNISVVDSNNTPIVLHMNETLVVEVDGNNIQVVRLAKPADWNPVIESDDGSSPGSNGQRI